MQSGGCKKGRVEWQERAVACSHEGGCGGGGVLMVMTSMLVMTMMTMMTAMTSDICTYLQQGLILIIRRTCPSSPIRFWWTLDSSTRAANAWATRCMRPMSTSIWQEECKTWMHMRMRMSMWESLPKRQRLKGRIKQGKAGMHMI